MAMRRLALVVALLVAPALVGGPSAARARPDPRPLRAGAQPALLQVAETADGAYHRPVACPGSRRWRGRGSTRSTSGGATAAALRAGSARCSASCCCSAARSGRSASTPSYKAELRRAETNRYLAEFRAPAVADAWQRLSAVWQAERTGRARSWQRVAARSGSGFDAALRNYQQFVARDRRGASAGAAGRDRAAVLRAPRRSASGSATAIRRSRRRSCGPAVRQFRNQHYYYFESEGLADEFDRVGRADHAGRALASRAARRP